MLNYASGKEKTSTLQHFERDPVITASLHVVKKGISLI